MVSAEIGGNTDGMNRLADFRVEEAIRLLRRLSRDETAPARVALRPQVFALVCEPLAEVG